MSFLFIMRIDIYHFSCSRNAKLYFVKVFSFVKINCTSVIGKEGKRYENRSLREHVLMGNECYTINIVCVLVDMLL